MMFQRAKLLTVLAVWSCLTTSVLAFSPAASFLRPAGIRSAAKCSGPAQVPQQSMLDQKPRHAASISAMKMSASPAENMLVSCYSGRVVTVVSESEWRDLIAASVESGFLVIAEFRAQWCRKCQSLEPKYKRLPQDYKGQAVVFAEVDGNKVGSVVRKEAKVKAVPSFQAWINGEQQESYIAGEIAFVMRAVSEMVKRHVDKITPEASASFTKMIEAYRKKDLEQNPVSVVDEADPLAAWRKQQTSNTIVRAVGASASISTRTMNRPAPVEEEDEWEYDDSWGRMFTDAALRVRGVGPGISRWFSDEE